MSLPHEQRVNHVPIEVRSVADNKSQMAGYAAKFNSESDILNDGFGDFIEIIAPNAFRTALAENPRIVMLWSHDTSQVLGSTRSGTLRLHEDEVGLAFQVDIPDTQLGRDLRVMIERGDIEGCSFGFSVPDGGAEVKLINDQVVRVLREINLFEISVVCFPAYSSSEVVVRSKAAHPVPSTTTPRLNASRRRLTLLDLV